MLEIRIMENNLKLFCLFLFLFVSISNSRGNQNCFPRWLTGSKSRIHVSFNPIQSPTIRGKRRTYLDFQAISIQFPKDITEILSCDFDPRTKIQIRYKEKQSTSREKIYHLLPNNIRQNVVISRLKPCTLYSLRVRVTFPESDTKLLLRLEDFYTGPNNVINSLDVKNVTDNSATVSWNPEEKGMGCATSFIIKQGIISFEVEPHKVLTTWRQLEPCNQYMVEVFPRFHGKLGKGTSRKYATFPNSKSFDTWIDASGNRIIWQSNIDWDNCVKSIQRIQYDFTLNSCSSSEPLYAISLGNACDSYEGCSIDIDYLSQKIGETVKVQPDATYNANLRATIQKNNNQEISFNILANLGLESNSNKKISIIKQFKDKCNMQVKEATINPILTTKSINDVPLSNPHHDSESHNSTLISIAFVASIFVTILIFSFYVYHNQVKKHVKRLSNRVNRMSQNMAPHYAQYFQGPMQERISIVNR